MLSTPVSVKAFADRWKKGRLRIDAPAAAKENFKCVALHALCGYLHAVFGVGASFDACLQTVMVVAAEA